jgi:hypothetical protein
VKTATCFCFLKTKKKDSQTLIETRFQHQLPSLSPHRAQSTPHSDLFSFAGSCVFYDFFRFVQTTCLIEEMGHFYSFSVVRRLTGAEALRMILKL